MLEDPPLWHVVGGLARVGSGHSVSGTWCSDARDKTTRPSDPIGTPAKGRAMSTGQIVMAHDALDDAALVIGPDGSILYANRAALDCYGHSLDAMLRLIIRDLRAPGDQADIDAHMRRTARAGALFESPHLRSDGSPFAVEVRSVSVLFEGRSALLFFMRDLTAEKRAEQDLAVADVVEAMTLDRPCRAALGIEAALAEIEQGAGRLYDTEAVASCVHLFQD